jgi:hypothetical protein
MSQGFICDDPRAGNAVRVSDVDRESMRETIADDGASLRVYISFVLRRPYVNDQAGVI